MAALGLGACGQGAIGPRSRWAEVELVGPMGRATRSFARQGHHHRALGNRRRAAGTFDWGYFPHTIPAFPQELIDAIVSRCNLPGLLALCHASGTQVIEDFGEEHVRTGKPIAYTSADSVIQIAAHEEHFGLERLYEVCQVARELTYPMNIGRVIARPFVGETAKTFTAPATARTMPCCRRTPTLLDAERGGPRCHLGRQDRRHLRPFGHGPRGEGGRQSNADGNDARAHMDRLKDGGFLMTNFVDFDTDYGHRRDVPGYARALEQFDRWLPTPLFATAQPGDRLVLTADHGNDPSWKGTDHSREQVPVLCTPEGRPFAQAASASATASPTSARAIAKAGTPRHRAAGGGNGPPRRRQGELLTARSLRCAGRR
jgi:phosphopentomutase